MAVEADILRKTTQARPANASHWRTRSLAKALRTTQSIVQRVRKANGLKPHLLRTFKLSNDPRSEEKLVDVGALVMSADEKSRCQALHRTQPSLPILYYRAQRDDHTLRRDRDGAGYRHTHHRSIATAKATLVISPDGSRIVAVTYGCTSSGTR
jgi:hypothetical protein